MIDLDDAHQLALADRSHWQARASDPASHWRAGITAARQVAPALPNAADVDLLWLALPPSLRGLGLATAAVWAGQQPSLHLWQPALATLNRRAAVVDPYGIVPKSDSVGLPVIAPLSPPPQDAHPVAVWGYLLALFGAQPGRKDDSDLLPATDLPSTITDANLDGYAPSVPVAQNRAKQLAQRLYDRMPIFWGEDAAAGVALDWRHRYVRYAEARAEWTQLDVIRQVDVMARFPRYWPQAGIYIQLAHNDAWADEIRQLRQLWQARRIQHETIISAATTKLAGLYQLLCLGEWVAIYAAALLGVDPAERVALDFQGLR